MKGTSGGVGIPASVCGAQMEPTGDTISVRPTAVEVKITSPRFLAFLTAQFLGAVNDSAFKMALVLFVMSIVTDEARQVRYSSVATALVPIPFLLFSANAGYLADRFPKHWVLLWTKAPEIVTMALATIGFYLHSIPFLFFVLFFTSAQTAFFSPAKFGILPEIFADADLSAANGILELTSDVATLLGAVLGVYVFSLFASNLSHVGLVFLAIACVGTVATLFVPRAPSSNPKGEFVWNIFDSFGRGYAEVRGNPTLYYTVIGLTWFGFLGSFLVTVIPVFGRSELGLDQSRVGLLFALLSIGVGVGSVIAGRLSHHRVEIGLVPIGSIGITIFSLLLAGSGKGFIVPILGLPLDASMDLILLGIFSGLFYIPLNAMLQQRAPVGMKGRLIAFSNVLRYSAIFLAAGVAWTLSSGFGLSIRQQFLFIAILTFAGSVYVVYRLPDFMVRLILWALTNTIYRIRTVGEENQPKAGALLVANHVSHIDGFLISGSTSRMVRYLIYRQLYEKKWVNWYFRFTHAIPVSPDDSREKIEETLESARDEIRHGHVVCIFAEGAITRTGNLLKFRRGFERIATGANCPIVPIYLGGVWGSIFSYDRGRFVFKIPKRLFEPITIAWGKPMASTARADEVRRAIQDLSARTFAHRKDFQKPIHLAFIRRAKRRWNATLATDADGSSISFGAALTRAIALSQALWSRGDKLGVRVGILMPPGIGAMLANFAALFAGHIPVNIDAVDVSHSAVFRAQLDMVVTTREYARMIDAAEKLSPATVKYFEDAEAAIDAARRRQIGIICRLMPVRLIARLFVRGSTTDVDQVATILFSYRAEAPDTPHGVMLTHHNLLSNLESLRQIFRVTREDCILGLIPFSNSMSFASTLLLPALSGARVAFGAELLGKSAIGGFCRANQISLIPASPAMLASILDTAEAADLSHLRQVAVGGGELEDEVRARFIDKFGIEPLQGYGCPECAPLISLNIPDFDKDGMLQPGTRRGSVGHPVPGVSVRIVDPSTGALVAQDVEGMLLVSGPNLMKGYAEEPELTRQVMNDGWYVTGDHARVDADGFLTIARRQMVTPPA
jgi:acyl-[acyl-carrier-protein]-phospholipid O-acyltransferase/long-chain-fatty-acid--[acyl-carrier-protein] ligase